MSAILDLEPISAIHFNSIPILDKNASPVYGDQLTAFAKLFVEWGVYEHYDLGWIHRHVNLADEEILVHRMHGTILDVCQNERWDPTLKVAAHSLFYCEHKFRPYEFDTCTDRPMPPAEFWFAFRDLLIATNMANRLAIVAKPPSSLRKGVEVVLPDNRGMLTKPRAGGIEELDTYETCWSFWEDKSRNDYTVSKSCAKDKRTGEHIHTA